MKTVIVVDSETTGLDPSSAQIVEVGAALYSVEHRTVIESFATLVAAPSNGAEPINRIPAAALTTAPPWAHAKHRLYDLVERAEALGDACFMAHSAEFDRAFLEVIDPTLAARLPWICSKFDVAWPHSKVGASCVEMALAHGVPVVSAHRALTDVMLIVRTLEAVQREGHDLPGMLVRALRPKATFAARTPKPWEMTDAEWTALKQQLLDAGFRFDGAKREWRATLAVEDADVLPFSVVRM